MYQSEDFTSNYKLFQTTFSNHLFVTNGSQVYDIDDTVVSKILEVEKSGNQFKEDSTLYQFLRKFQGTKYISKDIDNVILPSVNSISINIAQACNMSCSYCYADEGKFRGLAKTMRSVEAFRTVDFLFETSDQTADIVLGFIGGEPLLSRELLHATTRYAWSKAKAEGRTIRFSITTNGTLIKTEDVKLFHEYPFSVTISIDGDQEMNAQSRKLKNGKDAYSSIREALNLFQKEGRPNQLSARATVTPKSGNLLVALDHLINLGFDDVGFSPVLVSPDKSLEFTEQDFDNFLSNMVQCGEKALREIKLGRDYPFGNLETALQEIHKGTHRPYPCGAGAGYLSVNTKGNLFACHRFIDDKDYAMGDIFKGTNNERRLSHLKQSHVDLMEPCKTCWARYLCGGGCYHEVKLRGRKACNYIREWLLFCLKAYVELSEGELNR